MRGDYCLHMVICAVLRVKPKPQEFVRIACMVKNFKGMRICQVGTRPAPFFSVIWNEGELMEKFGTLNPPQRCFGNGYILPR